MQFKALSVLLVSLTCLVACTSSPRNEAEEDDGGQDDTGADEAGGRGGRTGAAGAGNQPAGAGGAATGTGGAATGTGGAATGTGGTSSPASGGAGGSAAGGTAGAPDLEQIPAGKTVFEQLHGFEPRFVVPPNSGMVNIQRDFGAVGDGKTDDTAAFKKAIEGDDPRTIFIPAGTYLIKEPLRYGEVSKKKKRVLLIGEQRSRTILRLADQAAGFGDPKTPRVFLHTRSSAQQAEQNMHNYIYHLTIEIGRNNPGAIALNFHTNNTGAIKDVTVRAADPINHPGLIGVAFDDHWFGPGNARYLEVDGFQTAIRIGSAQNHTTLEHVTARHCGIGLENTGYAVSVRGLRTFGCTRPVKAAGGLTVLVDSHLVDGPGGTAIELGKSGALLSNVKTAGYAVAVDAASGKVAGPSIAAWTSRAPFATWPVGAANQGPLSLPVAESPEHQYPSDPASYAVVGGSGDIAGALQAAIDAGKQTVFVTGGRIEKTVELRNRVERIMGLGVKVIDYATGTAPVFRLAAGESPDVTIELLYENYGAVSGVTIEQASPRTVVFRHGSGSYRTALGGRGGKVFIESVVGYPFSFDGVSAWVRDINTEMGGDGRPNIVNSGGKLWVLGQKTEDYATKLATRAGGVTELLGGTYRQNWDAADGVAALVEGNPLFVIEDASASLSYLTWSSHAGAPAYKYLVRERRGSETRNLINATHGGPGDGLGALYVGYAAKP